MTDAILSFLRDFGALLGQGIADTLAMLFVSTAIAYVLGIALGVVLYVSAPGSLRPIRVLYSVLGWVVNMARSIPFIILIVSVIPMTKAIAGTTVGVRGVIFPLVLSAAEALPSIVRGVAVTLISVLGYTAIAGAVGAGGLGDIAIRYGYYRYQDEVMLVTIVLLIALVQLIQTSCDLIARHIDHR